MAHAWFAVFKIGLWAGVYFFLASGAMAAILLMVELAPDRAYLLKPFIDFQGNLFKAAAWGLVFSIVFGVPKLILQFRGEKKLKGGNK